MDITKETRALQKKNGNLSYDISYAIFLQAQTASLLPTEILL
jgi:hypothetical protein